MVDWGRGYGDTTPSHLGLKVFKVRALCAPPLVPPVISKGAPLLVKDGIGREMTGQFGL
jgi:hypothetical protein